MSVAADTPLAEAIRRADESRARAVVVVDYDDKPIAILNDFNSGAMIENIVARAKKMAIKEFLETGQKGMRISHLLAVEPVFLPDLIVPPQLAALAAEDGAGQGVAPRPRTMFCAAGSSYRSGWQSR